MRIYLKGIRLLTAVLKPNPELNAGFQIASTVLRVVVGVVMVHNGWDKLSDIENFAHAYVEYIGLPFPIFFSYVAAFTESIGAPLVAIGLLTRPSALGLLATMGVAMYHHILVAGFNIPYLELSALYAACFLFFAVNGAGSFSVDAWLVKWLKSQISSEESKQRKDLEKSYQAFAKGGDSDVTEVGTGIQ
jgi:putative oxidoreductase